LNVERIAEAIEKIAGRDAALGVILKRCADRYTYTAMLKAVEGRNEEAAETDTKLITLG